MSFKELESKRIELRNDYEKCQSKLINIQNDYDKIQNEQSIYITNFGLKDDFIKVKEIITIKNIDSIKENDKFFNIDNFIEIIIINNEKELFNNSYIIITYFKKIINIKLRDHILNRSIKKLTENEIDLLLMFLINIDKNKKFHNKFKSIN
jgi:hypothetical protein